MKRVLVLGGYGAFGRRVGERLARVAGIEVILAGRDLAKAEACAAELWRSAKARVIPATLDGGTIGAGDLRAMEQAVLINATGPYQGQDYRLARACIAAGVHYLDLADAGGFAHLETITTIISPGNRFDPGLATTRSILGALGRPIAGAARDHGVRAWQGLRRVRLPGLGARWIGHCDAPDRTLFPRRYAGLRHADVHAAMEVDMFQLGLWGFSWLVRAGLVREPQRLAEPLLAMKRRLGFLGSDRGGMLVRLEGLDRAGKHLRLDWHLVAGSGHGPYIPATASALLARRLLDGTLTTRGATPCVGLLTLGEFLAEIADLDIAAGIA